MRGDLEWGSVPGLVRAAAARGDAEALVDRSAEPAVRLTWAELADRAEAAARAMVAAGVQPGDRVAIWAPNTWEWVVALLGLHAAGAALVPINTRYKGHEAVDLLARSRARLLVTVQGFLGSDHVSMLREAAGGQPPPPGEAGAGGGGTTPGPIPGLPHLERVVVTRGEVPAGCQGWASFVDGGGEHLQGEVDRRVAALTGHEVADVLFTSGTTGRPKGVMCTHAQSLRAFADWAEIVGLAEGDRYLIVNPFFHSFGYKAGILASIMTGAVMVPEPVFDVPAVVRAIEEERISMIPGPPTLYQSILNQSSFEPGRWPWLRLAVTGAASVPVELVRQMRELLGFQTVITAYGLTEACGVVTACRADDDAETIATTSGRAIPGVEVQVVGEGGEPVPPGEPGEVVVRGYNVMLGYFEDPEQTAEAIDADSWLHTGDIGVLDERGYLRITDRKKDMFIVGGFNAYPAEIEGLLLEHPDIAQVAVVGVPDERLGEVGLAFVVPRVGATPDPDDLLAWARGRMANFKVPRRLRLVEALPLNASGKVLKFQLRDEALTGPGGDT